MNREQVWAELPSEEKFRIYLDHVEWAVFKVATLDMSIDDCLLGAVAIARRMIFSYDEMITPCTDGGKRLRKDVEEVWPNFSDLWGRRKKNPVEIHQALEYMCCSIIENIQLKQLAASLRATSWYDPTLGIMVERCLPYALSRLPNGPLAKWVAEHDLLSP